jgi:subtilisin family serine protease
MKRRLLGAVTAVPVALAMAGTGAADAAVTKSESSSTDGVYIVQMADLPVVAYDGKIRGYAATSPAAGKKVNPQSAAVKKYVAHLETKHDSALARVGATSSKVYDYAFSFNGFAAKLTAAQAQQLAKTPGVLAVDKEQTYTIDTSSTPDFLGLTATGGLWEQLGGTKHAGEDILIGTIDSGIWPEHLSFSDRASNGVPSETGTVVYTPFAGPADACKAGEDWHPKACNNKLVIARHFNESWGGDNGMSKERPWEFNSPRDYNGHGSHTAGTSGGNHNVPVPGIASALAPEGMSGIAPRARVAAYKALWSTETGDTASGRGGDLVAAIDQAVADGVDVINYSISGSQTNFADGAEIAFLFAARAGVFVAASAGNSGPTASTVAHPSPWITTVAAGTHDRASHGSVTLGNGQTHEGASLAAEAVSAPFIDSTTAGLPGADPSQVALCYSSADGGNVLDPAKVAGKIVLCDRGVTARTNKSLAVKEAGGVGMVLVNTSPIGVNADLHTIPSVHLESTEREAVKAYAATAGATATLNAAELDLNAPAPFTAGFSSRGPLRAGSGDLLKPDVIAPGQDILAAYTPVTNGGYAYNAISGTSMSSPHVAGLAALLRDRHPGWSPMAIKSALMTTGYDVKDDADAAAKAFRQGAGHVDPNAAAKAGLVYNSGWNDWLAFLCGTTSVVGSSTCTALTNAGYSTDPSQFNGASLAIGALAGTDTLTRRVTNVGETTATYKASFALRGFDVQISPNKLTLAPGQTKSFTVSITREDAPLNAYTGGHLTWQEGTTTVRSPIVVRPVALAAPGEVTAQPTGASYDVTFGYTGDFSATARGLVPAAVTAGTVADDPTDGSCSLATPNAQLIPVSIDAGTTYARFGLFDADVKAGSDLDLCVFRGTALVGSSGSATSAEQVNLLNPAAGDYTVVVQGWGVDGTSPYKLHTWLLGSAAAGTMTVAAPTAASMGQAGEISLALSGLTSGRWLGSVAYSGADGMPNPTIVRVDVP